MYSLPAAENFKNKRLSGLSCPLSSKTFFGFQTIFVSVALEQLVQTLKQQSKRCAFITFIWVKKQTFYRLLFQKSTNFKGGIQYAGSSPTQQEKERDPESE